MNLIQKIMAGTLGTVMSILPYVGCSQESGSNGGDGVVCEDVV